MLRLAVKLALGLFFLAVFALALFIYSFVRQPFGPGYQDFAASLPHGYMLYRTSAHQITVWPGAGSAEKAEIIPAKVVELAHDDIWLLARQQHLQRRSPNDPRDTYEVPAPDVFSYWIVNMATHERLGPLDESAFTARRSELGIPAALVLHNVYDYRP